MLSPKIYPNSIPTPDGNRIIVFSTRIYSDPFEDPDPLYIEFEIYTHPANQNITKRKNKPWKKLPSLQAYLKKINAQADTFFVHSFAFITNSLFAIQLKKKIFAIDIDVPVPVWQRYRDPLHGGDFFDVLDGGQLWLTSEGPYDIANGVGHLFDPCKVQLAIQKRTYRAHVILDLCGFDLDKYRDDTKTVGADARLESSLVKSFKLVVDGVECYSFHIICLYTIGGHIK